MGGKTAINITTTAIQPQKAIDFVVDAAHGATDIFIGAVRDYNDGQSVEGITYDVFEGLAANVLQELVTEVHNRWGENLNIFVEHFKGQQEVGAISVVIAVSAPHREETFAACRYLIEEIKKRMPIWKEEHLSSGDSQWLEGHSLSAGA